MGVRGWPAWLGLWSAGVVGSLFAMATPEALELMPSASRQVDQVTATDGAIAAVPVLAGLVLPFVVGVACWGRRPDVTRGCLVVSALGLGAAAVVVTGIPDAGPWQPWVLGAAASLALLGAVLGTGSGAEPSRTARLLATAGLVLVGTAVAVLAWRGLEYQQWYWWPSETGPMWAALVGGATLVLVGAVGHRLPDAWWTAAPVLLVLLAGAALALTWAVSWMLAEPLLDRHVEAESAWATLPHLLLGAGLLAGAVALLRRWWSTAALSVVVGTGVAAAVLSRDALLWRLMW
ncbi:hypothetical protein ASG88_15580 [Nocardioides sp. Soil777]|uniref:hypothetical protein n=1 Tax=Nocardioides sp. Soil777 TaxID=1736409 RepID=UPI000702B629|nr:hypothetical protein [Nocardioides sp. Soil777]KRE99147.1 hypothetical protein ASG88_15580 [Nocardioides sp. Soil777]